MEGIKQSILRACVAGGALGIAAWVFAPSLATAAGTPGTSGITGTTGIARATMTVSLRIQEVCSIRSSTDRASSNGPQVQCQFDTPYNTQLAAADVSSTATTSTSTTSTASTNVRMHTLAAIPSPSNSVSTRVTDQADSTAATSSTHPPSVWIVTF